MPRNSSTERPWLNRAFSALGDPLCREIIEMIVKNPGSTVNDVCTRYSASRFTIMRHINLLEDAELLTRVRDGKSKKLFIDQQNLSRISTGWLARMGNAASTEK